MMMALATSITLKRPQLSARSCVHSAIAIWYPVSTSCPGSPPVSCADVFRVAIAPYLPRRIRVCHHLKDAIRIHPGSTLQVLLLCLHPAVCLAGSLFSFNFSLFTLV